MQGSRRNFQSWKSKGTWPKGERGLGKVESETILRKTGLAAQVGLGRAFVNFFEDIFKDF